jgi:hypothetical protein
MDKTGNPTGDLDTEYDDDDNVHAAMIHGKPTTAVIVRGHGRLFCVDANSYSGPPWYEQTTIVMTNVILFLVSSRGASS